jgi:flagellar hook assembly protein FlgD
MTAADWRDGAAGVPYVPPPPSDPTDPPQITSLVAGPSTQGGPGATETETPQFHPNGDGLDDELVIDHTVSKSAYLDAVITNAAGGTVRSYSVWSTGAGRSRWNGRNDAGLSVPDGLYTLTYTPRDLGGVTGDPVSVQSLVLTAAALAKPTKGAFFAADADKLLKTTTFKVTLNQPATVTWSIVNAAGTTVRTIKSGAQLSAGTIAFTWDGKGSNGAWVPEGRYRSVVSAQTGLGSYAQERSVFVGAFQINPSVTSLTRGGKVTLNIISSEPLAKRPSVRITQPGIAPWSVTTNHVTGRKYKITVTLKTGGAEGLAVFQVNGTDKNGGKQSSSLSLPLL